MNPRTRDTVPGLGLAAALLLAALGGCGGLLDEDPPERIDAEITSTGVDSVSVVTSTRFALTSDGGERFFEADTATVPLPHSLTRDIRDTRRFYIRVTPTGEEGAATVSMRVRVDGEVRYRQERDIREVPLQFRFVYAGGS